jgi:hypothetical protein
MKANLANRQASDDEKSDDLLSDRGYTELRKEAAEDKLRVNLTQRTGASRDYDRNLAGFKTRSKE